MSRHLLAMPAFPAAKTRISRRHPCISRRKHAPRGKNTRLAATPTHLAAKTRISPHPRCISRRKHASHRDNAASRAEDAHLAAPTTFSSRKQTPASRGRATVATPARLCALRRLAHLPSRVPRLARWRGVSSRMRVRSAGPSVRSKTVGSVLAQPVDRRRRLRYSDQFGFAERQTVPCCGQRAAGRDRSHPRTRSTASKSTLLERVATRCYNWGPVKSYSLRACCRCCSRGVSGNSRAVERCILQP